MCIFHSTFRMSLRNSDWLARSWWKMTPFTIHYCVATLPIPSSPIYCSATLTLWFLFPPYHLLPDLSLAPTHLVPSLLLSNFISDRLIALPLIFGNLPWYIRNNHGLLLLIVNRFASLSPYILLPPNWSLVCCCCHWSSATKYSPSLKNSSLHLHSTIYRPLIDPQSPWFFAVDCRLLHIADPIYISPTDPVPGLLLS